ncbi:hypothetical protein BA190_09280 [Labrys sp. WJW]|uniref:hypothetical protein n=1 Tax=Labrys sp. WJW TaxID=1737983 RepID=UPI000830C3E1|nr:hypothetical protein [Labrys sp. WJW]OCC05097.1 hypothetical protein BA190_09280 [Labrys sp. WJW]
MNVRALLIAAIAIVGANSAMADDANTGILRAVLEDGGKCRQEETEASKAACFEQAISVAQGKYDASIATAEKDADEKPKSYKVVDSDDLYVSPNKYKGTAVEWRNAQCLYADKDEYRCASNGRGMTVMIVARKITPDNERTMLENDCDSVKSTFTKKCRRTIRFTLLGSTMDDIGGIENKRVVLLAKELEIFKGK